MSEAESSHVGLVVPFYFGGPTFLIKRPKSKNLCGPKALPQSHSSIHKRGSHTHLVWWSNRENGWWTELKPQIKPMQHKQPFANQNLGWEHMNRKGVVWNGKNMLVQWNTPCTLPGTRNYSSMYKMSSCIKWTRKATYKTEFRYLKFPESLI